MKQEEGENFLNDIKTQISDRITTIIDNASITSRVKSVHGIFERFISRANPLKKFMISTP